MDKIVENTPRIIEAAAKSPLGIFALMIIALSVLGFLFFHKSSERTRVAMFVLMFVGVGTFGFAVFRSTPTGQSASSTVTVAPSIAHFRRTAATLSGDMVKVLLAKHGFYDKRWNPSGKGVVHQYEPQIRSGAVVVLDGATGQMWQKGGSGPMTFDRAEQYVRHLNAERFAGFNDWRLPTVEEAMSLMEPQAYDKFHIDPAFERSVNFIWTADRTTDGRVWVLYFYDGIVSPERDLFNAWVRVVRSFQ